MVWNNLGDVQSKCRNTVGRRGPSGGGRPNLWSGCFPHLRGVRDSQDESEQRVGGCTVPAADGTCVEEAAAAGRRFVVCSRGNQRGREAASRNRG